MKLINVTRYTRAVVAAVVAVIALGWLAACTGTSTPPSASTTAAAMPRSATFIGDIDKKDNDKKDNDKVGTKNRQVLGLAVQGDQVTAYTTDGTTEQAWFFGTLKDGSVDLTSNYQDRLTAKFDGEKMTGTLAMNMPGAEPESFSASVVSGPAGIYTATHGDARATWVVSPDRSMIGVMMPNSRNDREVIDGINKQQQDFMDRIRQTRLAQQMQQTSQLDLTTGRATMGGQSVTAERVTGDTRF